MNTAAEEPHIPLGDRGLGALVGQGPRRIHKSLALLHPCPTELGEPAGLPRLLDLLDPAEIVDARSTPIRGEARPAVPSTSSGGAHLHQTFTDCREEPRSACGLLGVSQYPLLVWRRLGQTRAAPVDESEL